MVISTLMGGWAISNLWEWFIVPTFHLQPLSVVQAIGLSMVVSYMSHTYVDTPEREESAAAKIGRVIGMAIFRPVFAVGFGWVIHQFM